MIDWKTTGGADKRDLIAFVPGGTLRVERLTVGVWWFSISLGDREFMSGEYFPHASSFESAKIYCETIYRLLYSLSLSTTPA